MGSSWIQDAFDQSQLTLQSLKLATEFLKPNGTFVTKVFRSTDYNSLIWVFRQLFKKVTATKPSASRNESAEIYVVCEKYLAPHKIDPKLLDSKYIFQQLSNPSSSSHSSMDAFSLKKKPRERGGYEDGVSLLYKEAPLSLFLHSDDPIDFLTKYNRFLWDEPSLLSHPASTLEIEELFKDLKLVGKKDVREILKWRKEILKFLSNQLHSNNNNNNNNNDNSSSNLERVKVLSEEEKEQALEEELEKKIREELSKKKRKLKKQREKQKKTQRKIDLNIILPGDNIEQGEDQELFQPHFVSKQTFDTSLPLHKEEEEEGSREEKYREMEEEEYLRLVEEHFEKLYHKSTPKQKKRFERIKENIKQNVNLEDYSFEDSEEKEGQVEKNELIVDLETSLPTPIPKQTQLWFSQEIFEEVEDQVDDEAAIKKMKLKFLEKKQKEEKERQAMGMELEEEEGRGGVEGRRKRKREGGFEEIELEDSIGDSIGESSEGGEGEEGGEEDSEERAKLLALGAVVGRGKVSLNSLVDSSFNKRAFDDPSDLPKWFTDEEKKHVVPQLPITKREVEEMKERMRELDARPIGKVAEAKAKKKRRMMLLKERVAKKAVSIVQAEHLSEQEKMRNIKKLYKQTQEKKKDKVYIVSRRYKVKGGIAQKRKGGRMVKFVDSRLKKDKRAQERAAKKKMKK